MKPSAHRARHAAALAASAALNIWPVAAQATVTYTYTGPNLDSFSIGNPAHPVTTSGFVASFVFEEALAPGIGGPRDLELVTPVSWSVSAGGYALSSSDVGARLDPNASAEGFTVFTDSSGAIQGWDVVAYVNGSDLPNTGPRFRSVFVPAIAGPAPYEAYRDDSVSYFSLPDSTFSTGWTSALTGGTWTVTAVPEPGTTAMWLAGIGALGLLLRRRGRV